MTTTEYGNCYTITSPKYIAMRTGPGHGKYRVRLLGWKKRRSSSGSTTRVLQ